MAKMPSHLNVTTRLELYDKDGMQLPGYLEIDVDFLIKMSRISVEHKSARIVQPEEAVTFTAYLTAEEYRMRLCNQDKG